MKSRKALLAVLVLLVAAVAASLTTGGGNPKPETSSTGTGPYVDRSARQIFLAGVKDVPKIRTARVQASCAPSSAARARGYDPCARRETAR